MAQCSPSKPRDPHGHPGSPYTPVPMCWHPPAPHLLTGSPTWLGGPKPTQSLTDAPATRQLLGISLGPPRATPGSMLSPPAPQFPTLSSTAPLHPPASHAQSQSPLCTPRLSPCTLHAPPQANAPPRLQSPASLSPLHPLSLSPQIPAPLHLPMPRPIALCTPSVLTLGPHTPQAQPHKAQTCAAPGLSPPCSAPQLPHALMLSPASPPGSCRAGPPGTPPGSWAAGCGTP